MRRIVPCAAILLTGASVPSPPIASGAPGAIAGGPPEIWAAPTGTAAETAMAASPPAGFTGGFGEASCLFCHTGNEVNAYGGEVRIAGLPEAYAPGEAYVLTVILEADETSTAGFQLTARFPGGDRRGADAGSLESVDGRTARTDSAGTSYLHQSEAGFLPPHTRGSSWSLEWTAPGSGETVAFHVAANSGNGDESPLGDLVYLAEEVVRAHH